MKKVNGAYKWLAGYQGLLLLVFIIATVLSGCSVIANNYGINAVWNLWNIPIMQPRFADLLNLTGGYETILSGQDPLYKNPFDPWGRPMNHPRIVQYIMTWIGIGREGNFGLGIFVNCAFLAGVLLAFRTIDKKTAIILSLVLFSPAVVLGIERGNHDLFIFFLVSLVAMSSRYRIASIPLLLCASFIKLFPIFGSIYLLRFKSSHFWFSFVGILTVFILYLFYNQDDLGQIFSSTQKGGSLSYGYNVIITNLDPKHLSRSRLYSFVPAMAIIILTSAYYFGLKDRPRLAGQAFNEHIDMFRLGAAIYIGTFLLGNSWDYRLMYLLFAVPQLVQWATGRQLRLIAILTIIGIIASCWMTIFNRGSHMIFFIDELSNYIIFSTLIYLLLASIPDWFYRQLHLLNSNEKK